MKTIASISLLVLLCGSCNKRSELHPGGDPVRTVSVAYLKSLCTRSSVRITQDIAIRGVVTGNDRYGEFYKMLVVEDASSGISVAADHSALADEYPFGTELIVYCNGLTLTDYGGKIELGATPDNHGAGRIPEQELKRYLRPAAQPTSPLPSRSDFSQITTRQIDTYVRFDGVRFTASGLWCTTDPETGKAVTTEQTITDTAGHTFTVRVAATCRYAKEPVPSGTGSLCGIIDYFNGKFSLRITNRKFEFTDSATSPRAYPSAGRYSDPSPKR